MTGMVIILILLVVLIAYFSATELAFILSNKIKIEIRARKNNIAAKNVLYFVKNPHYFFSTILILNTIFNIAFASVITIFLDSVFRLQEWQILLISTATILFLGELIPKYIARELADSLIMMAIIPLRGFSILLFPVVKMVSRLTDFFELPKSIGEDEPASFFDKEELKNLINESSVAGKVKEIDSETITKVIEMRGQKVYEAMTPRTAIAGVEINSSLNEVLKTFVESGYSKIIVYEENLDNIKGFLIAYDMFRNPKDLNSILRPLIYVPETKKSLDMLNEFLDKRISIAIVVDEFGGTAGLITVEDIIEEMFGEIRDEYDTEEEIMKKLDDNNFIISGKIEIDHLNEELELEIPAGDYTTIAGFITSNIGRIPQKGESVKIGRFNILIIRSDNTKISLVKVTIIPQTE